VTPGSLDAAELAMATMSKTTYVAQELRRMILDGTIPEGTSLRQRDVAEMLGVSPTPVREAFSQLQSEGYLAARRNAGSVVRPLGERMAENWRLRAALEAVAAEMAAQRATEADVAKIRECAHAFEIADDPTEAGLRNREFHFAIYAISGQPVLMRFLNELWQTLDINPTARRSHAASVAEHATIVDAIARGDIRAAGEYTRLHISGTAPATEPSASV
jgi:DNA-binding GntR family transcriptional regulator